MLMNLYWCGYKPVKRGRGAANKALVVVAVEDKGISLGRIRLSYIPDASSDSLNGFIQDSIDTGSIIRTDAWLGYNQLSSLMYKHIIKKEGSFIGENPLPLVHRVTHS
jgi:hypothetical protein